MRRVADRLKRQELEQVIRALTEGVILIEPDQRITFANKAALGMHGVRDVAELGDTVDEYRENFVLRYRNDHPLKPEQYPIERVVAGEAFDEVIVHVERRGHPGQDWVHRIRSLVINDENQKPDCLVLVIADVSDHFEAEERFESTFSANPAPAVICRLADQRFIKCNEGFLDMTGYAREDVLDRTLREIDVLERAERRNLALKRLAAGDNIPQMEACLSVPSDKDRLVIVAGQPIEVGDEPCMLFTFADLEARRQAEGALKESQNRLATLFRLAPVPMAVSRRDGHVFVDVNEAFCEATGYSSRDVLDRSAEKIGLWADAEAREHIEREVERSGRVKAAETRLRCKNGEELVALVSAEGVTIAGEACVLYAFQDISSRKRNETDLMHAIEMVMSDANWFSQAVVEKLAAIRMPLRSGEAVGQAGGAADLTARERDVLGRMCKGLDDAAIAADLKLSRNTVRNHVAALFRKIGVNRRSAAVVWARDRGFGEEPTRKRAGRGAR